MIVFFFSNTFQKVVHAIFPTKIIIEQNVINNRLHLAVIQPSLLKHPKSGCKNVGSVGVVGKTFAPQQMTLLSNLSHRHSERGE